MFSCYDVIWQHAPRVNWNQSTRARCLLRLAKKKPPARVHCWRPSPNLFFARTADCPARAGLQFYMRSFTRVSVALRYIASNTLVISSVSHLLYDPNNIFQCSSSSVFHWSNTSYLFILQTRNARQWQRSASWCLIECSSTISTSSSRFRFAIVDD